MKLMKQLADKARKAVARFAEGGEELNPAQRLIQSWFPVRAKFVPKRPHIVRIVTPTDAQHADKQGDLKFHQKKFYAPGKTDGPYGLRRVPTMLAYEHKIDQSKKYPYSSRRQTGARHIAVMGAAA